MAAVVSGSASGSPASSSPRHSSTWSLGHSAESEITPVVWISLGDQHFTGKEIWAQHGVITSAMQLGAKGAEQREQVPRSARSRHLTLLESFNRGGHIHIASAVLPVVQFTLRHWQSLNVPPLSTITGVCAGGAWHAQGPGLPVASGVHAGLRL